MYILMWLVPVVVVGVCLGNFKRMQFKVTCARISGCVPCGRVQSKLFAHLRCDWVEVCMPCRFLQCTYSLPLVHAYTCVIHSAYAVVRHDMRLLVMMGKMIVNSGKISCTSWPAMAVGRVIVAC